MGYRSDVAFALTKQGVDALKNKISKLDADSETRKSVMELLDNADNHLVDPSKGDELWYWEGIKWYEDYLDIAFIEKFLNEEIDISDYRLIRIGDDYDDTSVDGCFLDDNFDLRVSRSIQFAQ